MDDFKPEDELKPDTSDRRPPRSRKTSSVPKVPVSRQHIMMGVGILVLLLLVIGIGSSLNSSDDSSKKAVQAPATTRSSDGSGKNIDLTGSSSMSSQSGVKQPAADTNPTPNQPQVLSAPPISSTPTQAQPVQTPAGQQRVELPGDLNSALSGQQRQVDSVASGDKGSSLPTAPATVAGAAVADKPAVGSVASSSHVAQTKPVAAHKPVARSVAKEAHTPQSNALAKPTSSDVTGGNYTLQLSSASRPDTLNAWAKKQNLSNYHVYKTTRNGEPWYVLVSGSYATPAEAKHAVASLPADVQAKVPWVKPVSQVKKESAN